MCRKRFLKKLERENTIYFERISHDRITHRVGAHVVEWRGTSLESYLRRFVAIETFYSYLSQNNNNGSGRGLAKWVIDGIFLFILQSLSEYL